MHLQAEAAVFDDIGIYKARNDAFAKQGFAQALGQKGREIGEVDFGGRFQGDLMLAGVGSQVGWLDFMETELLTMANPEKETEDGASGGRTEEKPARFGHGGKVRAMNSKRRLVVKQRDLGFQSFRCTRNFLVFAISSASFFSLGNASLYSLDSTLLRRFPKA